MADNFGVVTFDDRGPIKTWSRMAAVAAHNNRAQPELHCDPSGPKPIHLCGTADLIGDVKAQLLKHGINPSKPRKNAAIAFEVIMTASRAFFEDGPFAEAQARTGTWIKAACDFARKHWGENRIVSMVLHLDETTPHIHVVLLPLVEKIYKRWPERGRTWALEARVISGPGMYQKMHDAHAAAMAPLGLVRGKSGSRAKYRPYAAELADLDAEKVQAAAAAAAAAAAKIEEESRKQAAQDAVSRADFENEQARWRSETQARSNAITEAEAATAREKAKVRKQMLQVDALKRRAASDADAVREERRAAIKDREDARRALADIKRTIEDLAKASDCADALRAGLLSVPHSELPAAARSVLQKIVDFDLASVLIRMTAADRDALSPRLQRRLNSLTGRTQ